MGRPGLTWSWGSSIVSTVAMCRSTSTTRAGCVSSRSTTRPGSPRITWPSTTRRRWGRRRRRGSSSRPPPSGPGASGWGRASTACRSTIRSGSSKRSACSISSRAGASTSAWAGASSRTRWRTSICTTWRRRRSTSRRSRSSFGGSRARSSTIAGGATRSAGCRWSSGPSSSRTHRSGTASATSPEPRGRRRTRCTSSPTRPASGRGRSSSAIARCGSTRTARRRCRSSACRAR